MRGELHGTTAAVARIEQDLLAERVGRIEDLELVIDLLAKGLDAVRTDVGRLSERLEGIALRLDEPLQVTVERPRQAGLRQPVLADRAGARERRARAGRRLPPGPLPEAGFSARPAGGSLA